MIVSTTGMACEILCNLFVFFCRYFFYLIDHFACVYSRCFPKKNGAHKMAGFIQRCSQTEVLTTEAQVSLMKSLNVLPCGNPASL
jgi:hypothetical protein